MRKIISLFLVSVSLFSFAQKKKYPVRDTGIKIQSDKIIKLFIVSGNVTQTSVYCGGAAPSEEMMKEYETPKPFAGKKFYIKKGNVNDAKVRSILTFTTNEKGNFNFQLAPGTYCILLEPQIKPLKISDYNVNGNTTADADCLKKWWKAPYYLLEVKDKDVSGIKFSFHHRCFVSEDVPCLNYEGPMPP